MDALRLIREAIETEGKAVQELANQVDDSFGRAIQCLLDCKGKVVVTGVGKSGIIGRKIAASLASTGQPAFFVHSTEAVHGDSGMIEKDDVVLFISNSGETQEVLNVIPIVNEIGSRTIAITSKQDSTLAKSSHVALVYRYTREADHLNLAPTTSSTLVLVIGDALAVTLSQIRGFNHADFHRYHPGGSLGEQLAEGLEKR